MKTRKHISHDALQDALTFEDILGKDVYDEANEFVGVSSNLYIDKKSMTVLGLAVDKGFVARGLVVGSAYIRRITKHAIFLRMRPAFRMRGMTVFDKRGARVGKVKEVELKDGNTVDSIIVRSRLLRKIRVSGSAIASVEENVFLNVGKEELNFRESD